MVGGINAGVRWRRPAVNAVKAGRVAHQAVGMSSKLKRARLVLMKAA